MIVESAVDLICSLDSEGVFLQVNSASQKLLGYKPAELIGIALHEIVVVEDRQAAADAVVEAVLRTKETAFELKMQAKEGHQVEMAWSTVWSESEKTLFCVAHDLSQRRQTERVKQEITAMISHDLRTPINSIQVAAELFARGTYGEFPPALTQRLVASTAKTVEAMDLINDLLDIEKFEKSTIELSFHCELLRDLIDLAFRDVAPQADEKCIKLVSEAEDVEIVADREQFVRVLRNLLRNSILCSPPDSEVIVSASIQDENIIISIEDAGPLVPDSERESMFDRFQSTDRSTSSRVEGMRLALCVCRALVEAHSGELYTGETSKKQFRFVVSIPV
jgi:PAS domain S-box-containing protein